MKYLLLCIILILTSSCSKYSVDMEESMKVIDYSDYDTEEIYYDVEWSDMIKWNDIIYVYSEEKNTQESYRKIDKELGEIGFCVIGSDEHDNAKYQLKNNEATYAKKGSKIYSIKELDEKKYIFVDNKVYSAVDQFTEEFTWNVNTKLDKNYKAFCLNSKGVMQPNVPWIRMLLNQCT